MSLVLHDAEAVVINAIEHLNLCSAYRDEPAHTPTEPYATVVYSGGGTVTQPVSTPSLLVYFHAQTWKQARTLGLTAEKLLPEQLLKDPLCFDVSIESTYRLDDPNTGQPRFGMTIDLTLAG